MKALEELGARVEVFPLHRQPRGPRHPEAAAYEDRAHFTSIVSWDVVRANARWLTRDPGRYARTWWEMLSGTLGSLKFFFGALAYFPKCVAFAEHIEALGVDHVHAHFASHPALAALIVHRLTGVPYSFTAHGSDLHVDRRMLGAKVASAAFVVAISRYNLEVIVQECGEQVREKVVVIHCGTDPSVFEERSDAGARRLDGTGGSRSLRVACVASLEEVKGHRFLIEACRLLADRGVDIRVDLAGGGSLRRDIERQIEELELGDRVIVHGTVARPDVERLLAAADVAVLASHPTRSGRREGIPVALMEAMMSGLPVVASALSGIPELVEDGQTGFLVPSGDSQALAEGLQRLVGEPELRRSMGAAGRAKVAAEFDIHACAGLLLEEITRLREDATVALR
jgi:glycosyltransferase involved in cell wall biosynthesis